MDKSGIAMSVLSSSSECRDQRGRERTQDSRASRTNTAHSSRADHKGRFANFATLPLLDTEGTLKEIGYALNTLKAEGIGLMTSYQDKYLGMHPSRRSGGAQPEEGGDLHPSAFTGVLQEHQERSAAGRSSSTPPTRRALSRVSCCSGTASRYPDIRWIFSHSGGTMPFLLSRFTRHEIDMKERAKERMPRGVMYELKKFHYDTAQGNHSGALAALMKGRNAVAGALRHGFPVPRWGRGKRRAFRVPLRGEGSPRHRTRQRAQAAADAQSVISATVRTRRL